MSIRGLLKTQTAIALMVSLSATSPVVLTGCGGGGGGSAQQTQTAGEKEVTLTGTVQGLELAQGADVRAISGVMDVIAYCEDGTIKDGYFTNGGTKFVVNVPTDKKCFIAFIDRKYTEGSDEKFTVLAVTKPIEVSQSADVSVNVGSDGVGEVTGGEGVEVYDVDVSGMVGKTSDEMGSTADSIFQQVSQQQGTQQPTSGNETQQPTSGNETQQPAEEEAQAYGNVDTGWLTKRVVGFGIDGIKQLKDKDGNKITDALLNNNTEAKKVTVGDKDYIILENGTDIRVVSLEDLVAYDTVVKDENQQEVTLSSIKLGDTLMWANGTGKLYAIPYDSLTINSDKKAEFKAYEAPSGVDDTNLSNYELVGDELVTSNPTSTIYRVWYEENDVHAVKLTAASLDYVRTEGTIDGKGTVDYNLVLALANGTDKVQTGKDDFSSMTTLVDTNTPGKVALVKWDSSNKKFTAIKDVALANAGVNSTASDNATKLIRPFKLGDLYLAGINIDNGTTNNTSLIAVNFNAGKIDANEFGNGTDNFTENLQLDKLFFAHVDDNHAWLAVSFNDTSKDQVLYLKTSVNSNGLPTIDVLANGTFNASSTEYLIPVKGYESEYLFFGNETGKYKLLKAITDTSIAEVIKKDDNSTIGLKAYDKENGVFYLGNSTYLGRFVFDKDSEKMKKLAGTTNSTLEGSESFDTVSIISDSEIWVKSSANKYYKFVYDAENKELKRARFKDHEIKPIAIGFTNTTYAQKDADSVPYYNKLEFDLDGKGSALLSSLVDNKYAFVNGTLVEVNTSDTTDAKVTDVVDLGDISVDEMFVSGSYVFIVDDSHNIYVYKNDNGTLTKVNTVNLGATPQDVVSDSENKNIYVVSTNGFIYHLDEQGNTVGSVRVALSKQFESSLVDDKVYPNDVKLGYAGNYIYAVASFNDTSVIVNQTSTDKRDYVYILVYKLEDGKPSQEPVSAVKVDSKTGAKGGLSIDFAKVVGTGKDAKLYIGYTLDGTKIGAVYSLSKPTNPQKQSSRELSDSYEYVFSSQGIIGYSADNVMKYTFPNLSPTTVYDLDYYLTGNTTEAFGYGNYFFAVDNATNKDIKIIYLEDISNKKVYLAGDVDIGDLGITNSATQIAVKSVGGKTYLYVATNKARNKSYIIVYDLNAKQEQ